MAFVQHHIVEQHIALLAHHYISPHVVPQRSWCERVQAQKAVHAVVAIALAMVCQVRLCVVDLATDEKLTVVQPMLPIVHSSFQQFLLFEACA